MVSKVCAGHGFAHYFVSGSTRSRRGSHSIMVKYYCLMQANSLTLTRQKERKGLFVAYFRKFVPPVHITSPPAPEETEESPGSIAKFPSTPPVSLTSSSIPPLSLFGEKNKSEACPNKRKAQKTMTRPG